MFVVDTNVLVYAANRDSPFHRPCARLLASWREQPGAWFLTWGIMYEFLRVVTHPRVLSQPWSVERAWGFCGAVLASPGLIVLTETQRHAEVMDVVVREVKGMAGNLLHDGHTAVLMREHGVRRIYTRDTDFFRFPFLEPVDPIA